MIFLELDFSKAEARKYSIIPPKRGDLNLYCNFHLAQSVPIGALFASSTT